MTLRREDAGGIDYLGQLYGRVSRALQVEISSRSIVSGGGGGDGGGGGEVYESFERLSFPESATSSSKDASLLPPEGSGAAR